jgi:hypothetical protein
MTVPAQWGPYPAHLQIQARLVIDLGFTHTGSDTSRRWALCCKDWQPIPGQYWVRQLGCLSIGYC